MRKFCAKVFLGSMEQLFSPLSNPITSHAGGELFGRTSKCVFILLKGMILIMNYKISECQE